MSGSTGLGRRRLLQLTAGAGLAMLAGCRTNENTPRLLAASETLPRSWRRTLPSPWTLMPLKDGKQEIFADAAALRSVDLIALTDGWLSACPEDDLQPVQADPLRRQLDATARQFLDLFSPSRAEQLLPVGVSPWVMLFRGGQAWQGAAERGWDLLLDPALAGRIVLPASPRFVIALADRMAAGDALERLRRQVLTFDDRQGINWLLKDRARLVVTPLQRCMGLLKRDPRLSAVLPEAGAPLHWTLLVRPRDTREPLPQEWVDLAWGQPLRTRLLASGWRPPLQSLDRDRVNEGLPRRWMDLLIPSPERWARCWSLPPLSKAQQDQSIQRWRRSAP